jgi:hypothetical protein
MAWLSFYGLKKAVEKYRAKKTLMAESENNEVEESLFVEIRNLIVYTLLFILEVIITVYAIAVAIGCTTGGIDTVIHVSLAVLFGPWYLLSMIVFSKSARDKLNGSLKITDVARQNNDFGFKMCGFKMNDNDGNDSDGDDLVMSDRGVYNRKNGSFMFN